MKAWDQGTDYKTLLLANDEVTQYLTREALDDICRPENSLTHIDEIFDRNLD